MEMPEKITVWSVPDSIQVPDGYDMTQIPDLTRDNFNYLIDEHNKMVEIIEILYERLGIDSST